MKLGPWRFGTHKATGTASQLIPALDRVREIREHAAWEPVTPPENIQQRTNRVAAARERIIIPPLDGERQMQAPNGRRIWLQSLRAFLCGMLALITVFAIVLWLVPKSTPEAMRVNTNLLPTMVGFSLPDGYPYTHLTENEAAKFARRALLPQALDLSHWRANDVPNYLLRISDYEGTVLFRHQRDSFAVIEVTVKLEPEEQRILCTIYSN